MPKLPPPEEREPEEHEPDELEHEAGDHEEGEPEEAPYDEADVIAAVVAGEISPAEAGELLEIPVGQVLRRARESSSADGHPPESKDIDDGALDRFAGNWSKAHEGAEIAKEELPPMEQFIHSFAPARWLIGSDRRRMVTALIACTALGIGVFFIATRDPAEPQNEPGREPPNPSAVLPSKSDFEAAEEVARAFLAAGSWREKLRYVRRPERTAAMMKTWYEDRGETLAVVPEVEFAAIKGTAIHGRPFIILETTETDAAARIIAIDLSGDKPAVDWESHVHYQPMSWEAFKRLRPIDPMRFRVRIEPSDYYIEPFDNEGGFVSYRLTSPLDVIGLNGFVSIKSRVALRLQHLTEFSSKGTSNVILFLRFTSTESQTPAVEITEVTEGWITP